MNRWPSQVAILVLLALAVRVSPATGQTKVDLENQTGGADFSSFAATKPAKSGTVAALPATCSVGEQYFATDASAGQNLFGCTSVNTWTVLAGGAAGKSSWSLRVVSSADTLTTGDGKAETGNMPNSVAGKTIDRVGCHLDFAAVSATGTTTIVLHNMVSATDVATVTIGAGSQDGFTTAVTGGLISENDTFRFDIDTITSGGTTEKGASCYVEAN